MDLFGTDDNFVIPVQSIKNDDELCIFLNNIKIEKF